MHERVKGWKIRRTLEPDGAGLSQRYEFLRFNDTPPGNIDPIGEWVDDPMDASIFTHQNLAYATRDVCRANNWRTDVIYHAVVEV